MAHVEEPTVTVRGDAVVRVEPDEALVWITLTAVADAPGSALSDVAERSSALLELLDELGIPGSDRSTTGVTVQEEFDHTPEGRHSLGYHAASRLSVRLVDADVAGTLFGRATRELDARIDGPRWSISLGNPARLEAARLAAASARLTAEAYAEGIGASLGRLLRLAEPGEPQHVRHALAARPAGFGGPPVEAGEQDVVTSVWATFALEPA
jgi:uncharacterized protein YggE